MRHRVESDPAEEVGGVVALAQRGGGVGILMCRHGEHEHGQGEDEFAELCFQVAVLFGETAEGYITGMEMPSQSGAPLDLAGPGP